MSRARYTLLLTSHHTEAREALDGASFASFHYLLGDLELLDEIVEPLQRFVEGHELA